MAKLKREEIRVCGNSWSFQENYEDAISHLEDESIEVLSLNVLKHKEEEDGDWIEENLVVFYKEKEETTTNPQLQRYGSFQGSEPLYTLDEITSTAMRFGEEEVNVFCVLADDEIIFENVKISAMVIFREYDYWNELQAREGRLLFVTA